MKYSGTLLTLQSSAFSQTKQKTQSNPANNFQNESKKIPSLDNFRDCVYVGIWVSNHALYLTVACSALRACKSFEELFG